MHWMENDKDAIPFAQAFSLALSGQGAQHQELAFLANLPFQQYWKGSALAALRPCSIVKIRSQTKKRQRWCEKRTPTFSERAEMDVRSVVNVGRDESVCSSAERTLCSPESVASVSLREASRVSMDASSSSVGTSNPSFKVRNRKKKKLNMETVIRMLVKKRKRQSVEHTKKRHYLRCHIYGLFAINLLRDPLGTHQGS